MLLHLYVASREERVNILTKEITAAADVPYTTALRWLDLLENVGEISRSSSNEDGRVTFIALTGVGLSRVERSLAAMVQAEKTVEASYVRAAGGQPTAEAFTN